MGLFTILNPIFGTAIGTTLLMVIITFIGFVENPPLWVTIINAIIGLYLNYSCINQAGKTFRAKKSEETLILNKIIAICLKISTS